MQAELQQKLNRPVTLGHLGLRLFPLGLRVDGLTIGEGPQFPSAQPFATAKEVYVSVGLMSLIHGNPDVKELNLNQPQIELIRNPAGVWNFSTIGGPTQSNTVTQSSPANKSSSANNSSSQSSEFSLDALKITDGQVGVTDELTKKPRTVYNHIDLRLSGFAPGKPFGVDLALHLPEPGNPQVALNGTLALSSDSLRSSAFTVRSGSTVLTGNFALSHYSTNNMLVDASVKTTSAKIAELLNVAKAYGLIASQDVTGSGNLSLDVHVQGPVSDISKLTYSGVADIPNATLSAKSLSEPLAINAANLHFAQDSASVTANTLKAEGFVLTNVRANAKFGKGLVQLSPVSASIFGGTADGTVSVDTKPAKPLCSVNMKFSGVDTNALLSAVSSMKDTLYGSLAGQANTNFALESGAELAQTLNGTLNFNVTNGQLKNVNILSELARVGKFLGSAPAQGGSGTALRRFSGTLNVVNGVATTNNLVANLDTAALSATGSLNLVNEGIDMHMTAVLNSGASQSVGGTSVGGFLNTALANNKGELVLPVLVTGTMAHPVFAPDVQAIAKMKLSNLLPTTGDPSKLTTGIIGSVLGKKGAGGVLNGILGQGSTQKGQQQQQQNPINSLFNQFGKKKSTKSTKP